MRNNPAIRWLDPRRSFRAKLTLAVAFLVIVTLAGATFVTVQTVRSNLVDQTGENFEAQAGSIGHVTEAFFFEKVSQLQVLALSDVIRSAVIERNATYSGSSEEILAQIQALDAVWVAAAGDDPLIVSVTDPTGSPAIDQLAGFLADFEDHTEVFVTDRYGATVAATGRLSDYYQADEGWWQAGWNNGVGAVYISNPEFDESAGVTALLIAVPVFGDETGEVIGLLRSTLNVNGLFELIAGTTFGRTGHAMLLAGSGEILVDARAQGGEGPPGLAADLQQKLVTEASGFKIASDQEGKKWIFGHSVIDPVTAEGGEQDSQNQIRAAVANLGWSAVVRQEADEALASVDAIERGALVSGLVAIGLASLAMLVVARAITRPLVTLSRAAEEIGAGNLDAPLPPASADEVGRLSMSFGNMAARLRDLIGSLQARTVEISGANEQLEREISERKQMEEAVRESEARYRLLAENTSDLIWTMDLGLKYTYMSPSITRMRGYTVEEMMDLTAAETMTPASLDVARKTLAEEMAIERMEHKDLHRSRKLELEMYCKDGSTIWTEMNMAFLRDSDGNPIGIVGVTRDISERKKIEEALRESEGRYRLIAENASDVIWTMDLNLRYTYVSPSVERMRGHKAEEIIGSRVNETMTPASLRAIRKVFTEEMAIEKKEEKEEEKKEEEKKEEEEKKDLFRSRTLEAEMYCRDGSTVWTEIKMTFLREEGGRPVGILGVTRDISERKRAEQEREGLHAELELRAITDSLTGLYGHAYFYQRLAEEMDRSKRYKHGFAVVMMDVDDFKRFNDARGHQAGDKALRLISYCIRTSLRRSDIAFRYGGDEFAAILPHADPSKARAVVNRINRRITKSTNRVDGGASGRLSLSAGVARFPDDGTTADDLVRIADASLYSAKWVARARDIVGQREDIQSLVSTLVGRQGGVEGVTSGAIFPPEALHEQQARIVASVASSIAVALKDAGVSQALEDPDLQIVAVVGAAAEIKDQYIRGHPERMSQQATALAEEMGLSLERVRDIRIAALLHDIGKVTVSESILNKPGKLTRREFDSIRDHPIVGATLVSQVRGFERLVPIIRHHHERFDGKGYPDGLAGEDIPLEARILSVVDVFDALTHQRSYRNALSRAEALAVIEDGAGTQFDPVVVEAFAAFLERWAGRLGAPAEAGAEDRQLAATRAPRRRKG